MDSTNVPQGFGAALSRSEKAARAFSLLNEKDKKRVVELSRKADSETEMNEIIGKLEKGTAGLF